MRPGETVTITFADGTVFRGLLNHSRIIPAETMQTSPYEGPSRRVVARPARLELLVSDVFTEEPPPLPFSHAAPPAPEPEDPNWGIYG